MAAENPGSSFYARAKEFARRLGVPAIVLFGALLFDILFLGSAAIDDAGPKWVDLWLFPGIFAMAGCVWWARSRAAVAAVAGAGVLVLSSVLIRYTHAPTYSSLLANLSITEVVAGVELVYFAALKTRLGVAFAVIGSLVVGALCAVFGRVHTYYLGGNQVVTSMFVGFGLLAGATVLGLIARPRNLPKPKTRWLADHQSPTVRLAAETLRNQWPLVGILAPLLLIDFIATYNNNLRPLPMLVCSIAAAGIVLIAPRFPGPATVALAAVFFLTTIVSPFAGRGILWGGGLTLPEVAAGMGMVVHLVRLVPAKQAWPRIGLLAAVVAISATFGGDAKGGRVSSELLGMLFVVAALLLGLAVATGLFLRSRDRERKQVIKSAVTDAQTSERMALARELHDVVAHHVTGIVVQAQAAKMMAAKDPQIAVEAMGRIEHAGTEALVAMRRLVRSMRGDEPAGSSEFSEQATTDLGADLRKLVEGSQHGVETSTHIDLPPDLPHEVGRSALRLVQEALTNIGKHASGATEALVVAEVAGEELHLQVTDNGQEPDRRPAGGSGGYGLVGMRERVALLHGRISAGRAPDGGWRVEAWLPLAEQRNEDE
ncbi:sensor histidine kinase [Amycolatopsis sp. NPDC059021]|uniref:sensor histidine kinase n=1 Tax=Amycolatopsis sp. NPDC059021 TaxID=3346704 RepID=UPI00366FA331